MRRLPIYFLIDVSESMVGEPIQLVEDGLATILKALREDPYALETAWISVIVFAGRAKTLVPLQEIVTFYPPKFPIGGGTSLSSGLSHLMAELRHTVVQTTKDRKGDWKPIVFLFTDGVPTDGTASAVRAWKQHWGSKANLVAVSFGSDTDLPLLRELTEHAFLFKNTDPQQYKEFFRWVTASIKSSSASVDSNGSGFELSRVADEVVARIDLTKDAAGSGSAVDNNYAVFAAKCQHSKRPYLIKYRRALNRNDDLRELGLETLSYKLVGAFVVTDAYFELSDTTIKVSRISTEELEGFPSCPSCGSPDAFGVCACGRVLCIDFKKQNTCPWCGIQGYYKEQNINLNRAKG